MATEGGNSSPIGLLTSRIFQVTFSYKKMVARQDIIPYNFNIKTKTQNHPCHLLIAAASSNVILESAISNPKIQEIQFDIEDNDFIDFYGYLCGKPTAITNSIKKIAPILQIPPQLMLLKSLNWNLSYKFLQQAIDQIQPSYKISNGLNCHALPAAVYSEVIADSIRNNTAPDVIGDCSDICDFFNGRNIRITHENAESIYNQAKELKVRGVMEVCNKIIQKKATFRRGDALANLQKLILDINENNIEETFTTLMKSEFIDEQRIGYITRAIVTSLKARYHSELLIPLIKKINDACPYFLKSLQKMLLSDPRSTSILFFLKKLVKNNILNAQEMLADVLDEKAKYISYQLFAIYQWFAPEIEEYFPDIFRKHLIEDDRTYSKQNNDKILNYKEDNWKRLNELTDYGSNLDPIAVAIRKDNVSELQTLISSDPEFDYDTMLKSDFYERSEKLFGKLNLMKYAAFFGSVECFKYLMLNGAKLDGEDQKNNPNNLLGFAIAGGNLEIIRIISQNGNVEMSKCLNTAIQFFRTDIYNWIQENHPTDLFSHGNYDSPLITTVFDSNNLEIFLKCWDYGIDRQLTLTYDVPLVYLASKNCVEILEFFLKVPGINANIRNNSFITPLTLACKNGNIDMIQVILDSHKADINLKGQDDTSPLINAIRSKKLEAVKLIGEYPGTDFKLLSPLQEAEKVGIPEIINYIQSKVNGN